MQVLDDHWAKGASYDAYMGRWSRALASVFLGWLQPKPGLRWLDVGCGTGALATAIIQTASPEMVIGCDPSAPFIAYANDQGRDSRLSFQAATLENLPHVSNGFGAIVSGLVLNFIPEPVNAVQSMMKRAGSGGLVAAYVWDYAGRMDFLRTFWDAAVTLDPAAEPLDEGRRFPLCQPERLENTFREAGLSRVKADALEIPTLFTTFSDYWDPFLAGTGPAPNYVASLRTSQRKRLAVELKQRIDPTGSGNIEMIACAWAIRGELE